MRLLLFLTVISLPIPAVAQPAFNQFQAAKKIAAEVAHEIGLNNEVFVREFRGIGETHVGLSKLVSNALQRNHDINNRRGASCEVDGRIFRYPIDESQPIEGFTIQVNVILPVGERKISIDVSNVDEGMILVGKSSELAAPPSKPQGSAAIPESPRLESTIIRPAPDSPYGVEFLFLQDGKFIPVPLVMKNNQITASVKKGDLVAVKLYNSSGYEAAADVLVDGLSRFITASSEENRDSLDLIENNKPRLITGWYKDNQSVDSFRVGTYSRSVGFQFDADPGSAGTFTIAFRSAWKEGTQPPPNEPPKTRGPGIERGPERLDPTVNVKRETGRVRAIVKIYYDE